MAQAPQPPQPLKHPVAARIIAKRLKQWEPVADQAQIISVRARVLRVLLTLIQ
jgi:hypothetical protein